MQADRNTAILLLFKKFTIRQVNQIIKHAISNSQIYKSYGAKRRLIQFVINNKDRIGQQFLKRFQDVFYVRIDQA